MSELHVHKSRLCLIIAIISGSLLLCGGINASPIYGNLPTGSGGYEISTEAGNTFGVAAEFTPQENVTFSSITLWVSAYTGLDGSSLQLSLMQDGSSIGLPFPGPANTIGTGTAPANDGSDAAFAFSFAGQLQAHTPYWLFLYLQVPGGGFGTGYGQFNCRWDQGGTPTGNVVINGSESYADGFLPSSFQSEAPAFAINGVPDVASTAVMLIISFGSLVLVRRHLRGNSPA
ncbi:MAG: VPDSG-CTERM sorting domain-containing protein [Verrucomicrobiota bacterium]|jgi:hypothetical protein